MVFFHLAFVLVGVVTTLLGPLLPHLSRAWRLDDAQLGTMLGAQFLASVAGGLTSTAFAHRYGARRALGGAFCLLTCGLGLLLAGRWPLVLAAPALWGLGLGLVVPETNMLVALTGGASALSLFNVMWSGGALLWSLTVFVAGASIGPRPLVVGVAALAACVALGFAMGLGPTRPAIPAPVPRHGVDGRWAWRPAAIFAAILFLYGGVENSVGGWAASFVSRFGSEGAVALGAIAPAAFYAALALGRLGTVALLRSVSETTVLRVGQAIALASTAAMLALHDATQVIAAAFVAGLGCAVVYPITAAAIAREIGRHSPRVAGPLLTSSGLGSAALPWLVGQVSNRTGSLRAGLSVAVVSAGALLALTLLRVKSPAGHARESRT